MTTFGTSGGGALGSLGTAIWGGEDTGTASPTSKPPVNVVAPATTLQPVRTAGGDLSFTNAGYGGAIPLVFGADKITGNIIWASPIVTNQVPVNGEYVTFQSVDFALALCEGPIEGVLRMWLGDRLVYDNTMTVSGNTPQTGANGVINSRTLDITDPGSALSTVPIGERQTQITVFNGSENQIPYGVMVQSETLDQSPAYRGTAYILFENFVTSGTDTPALIVEVAANTSGFFPRLSNTPQGSQLTTLTSDGLLVNPAWNQIMYVAEGAGAGDVGLIAVNYASLEEEANFEIENAFFDGANLQWNSALVTGFGNVVVHGGGPANSGVMRSVNPLSNVGLSSIGPNTAGTNGEFYINELGFPGIITDMCTITGFDEDGNYTDFIFATGNWQKDIGLVYCDTFANLRMASFETNVFPKENQRIEVLRVSSYRYGINPAWPNGDDTYGNFIFYTSEDDTETDQIDVGYIRLGSTGPDDPEDTFAIEYQFEGVPTGAIDLDLLGGKGVPHAVADIIRLPHEGLVLLLIKTSTAAPDWIVKYNPYTNTIVWKTSVEFGAGGTFLKSSKANLDGASKYAFIDNDDAVISINLATGKKVTVVADIVADQSLPDPGVGVNKQYYDGVENSIVYFSSGQINKVYLERTAVGITSVPVIITSLFNRIGVTEADIGYKQINSLNLRGYSITEQTTINSVINSLRQVYTFEVIESNGRLSYVSRGGSSIVTIPNKWLSDAGDGEGSYLPIQHGIDIAELRKIDITYRDVDREYMENVQNVYYPSTENNDFDQDSGISVQVPVVLNADEARYLADKLLYSKRVNEVSLRAVLPFRYAYLDPGDIVNIEIDDAGTDVIQCRITRQTITRDMQVEVELVQEDADIYNEDPGFGGVIGRFFRIAFPQLAPLYRAFVLGVDAPPYQTNIMSTVGEFGYRAFQYYCIFDLLRTDSTVSTEVSLLRDIQAYSDWQTRIDRYYSPPRGERISINAIREPAWRTPRTVPTWGFVTQPPGYAGSPHTVHEDNTMTIRVMHEATGYEFQSYSNFGEVEWYTHADYATAKASGQFGFFGGTMATFNGENTVTGNMLIVGNEFIRFRQVTDNGDGTYTLTGIMRGCSGTDWAVPLTRAGDIVVMWSNLAGTPCTDDILKQNVGEIYREGPNALTPVYAGRLFTSATEAGFESVALNLVSNNPRQVNPVYTWSPYNLWAPDVHKTAVYDVSGNVDISWIPRTVKQSVTSNCEGSRAAGDTMHTYYVGFDVETHYDEWPDDGDSDDPKTLGGLAAAPYQLVLATQALVNPLDPGNETGFLRTEEIAAGTTTYEYTTANQTTDGFDSTTDTLYIYVWPKNPATVEELVNPVPIKLRNL